MLTEGQRRGYQCEFGTADVTDTTRSTLHGSFDAYSPPQADRWVAVALRTITPELDSDASDEAWAWLCEGRIAIRQALLRAEPCTITVTHAGTRITWTIRVMLFLPLAHRQGVELLPYAYDFKPQSPDRVTTASTGSRRPAPLTVRGTAPGQVCAPISAPLHPGRHPCRAHSNQPLTLRERGTSWLGDRLHGFTEPLWREPRSWLRRRAYRAGSLPTRRAASLRNHDHLRQSGATPKPLHQRTSWLASTSG